ncbi:MAG TPA: hypothetical protein VHO25_00605 [Polyangiaceae bacterium]|nr:hypothetical protein [Polyangiaceae bacterium]
MRALVPLSIVVAWLFAGCEEEQDPVITLPDAAVSVDEGCPENIWNRPTCSGMGTCFVADLDQVPRCQAGWRFLCKQERWALEGYESAPECQDPPVEPPLDEIPEPSFCDFELPCVEGDTCLGTETPEGYPGCTLAEAFECYEGQWEGDGIQEPLDDDPECFPELQDIPDAALDSGIDAEPSSLVDSGGDTGAPDASMPVVDDAGDAG